MCGTVYVETMPEIELDPNGATLEYTSGGQTFRRRYHRAMWRRFLECEIRRLNEWEAANRGEVVAMGKRRAH